MQKLTNRYLLIAAALFLVLSGYVVPAQDITASPRDARAGTAGAVTLHAQHQTPGPALKSERSALAEWFDLVMRYYGPESRGDEARLEVASGQTQVASVNLAGSRATTEFAW